MLQKITRASLSAIFLVLAASAFWATHGDAQPGTVKQITSGVWFREGERAQGHCNNIIIEMRDYLVVIDANFPSGAEAVLADVKKLSEKPVRFVFDTHHHGDHAYGNAVWTSAGATTLAYAGVLQEMQRYEPKRWMEAATKRADVRNLDRPTAEPPKQIFDKTPYVLEDGGRRVEFHHFGWAHTRGDGFAFLPNEKILCTGDAVVNGPFNYTGDGNTGNWPNVVAEAMKLGAERVLPGHGAPGGANLLEGQRNFFLELNQAVEQAHRAGKRQEDVVTVNDGAGVETTIELPESVRNWVGDRFPEQVRVRWAELAEGRPHGEILGGK